MRSSTGTWLRAPRLPPDVALTVRAHDHTGLGPPPTKPHCAGQRRDLLVQTRRCSFPRTTRQLHRPVGEPALQRRNDLHIVQSGIVLQAHLDLFEQGIAPERRNERVITVRD